MKKYIDLNLGFGDAINYKKRENKELLNKYFVKDADLDRLLESNIYFLIGDKGTGKTAFSIYLNNNEYKDNISSISYISETEYVKFISLKKKKQLTLSDYTNIWKVLALLLVSSHLEKGESIIKRISHQTKFDDLKRAIDEFYNSAFAPELITALNIVENSKEAAEIFSKFFKISSEEETKTSFSENNFQLNLLYLERLFKDAISSIKFTKNKILFIDGIDIRPRNIDYEDYLECVKGLANAVWELNNNFFANIKDSKGRIKIVLLVRPDIFSHLGLQNLNNKIRDNSVLLDWKTIYPAYKSSKLFEMADRILSIQQEDYNLKFGEAWEQYFPFKNESRIGFKDDSFISFLRFSMFKPRDINTLMKILQDHVKADRDRKIPYVDEVDFNNSHVRTEYSDYLLGEVKDYLAFYHSDQDYELFLKFFEFLEGKAHFSYDEYIDAFNSFADYIEKNNIDVPKFFESDDKLLQFLYDLNIISYIEDTDDGLTHIHWAYRDRSYSNVSPKVKEGVRYSIHYGLQKAFNTGKRFVKRRVIKRK